MNLLPILLIGGAALYVFRDKIFGEQLPDDGKGNVERTMNDMAREQSGGVGSGSEEGLCPECTMGQATSEYFGTKVKEGCLPCNATRYYKENVRENLGGEWQKTMDGLVEPPPKEEEKA